MSDRDPDPLTHAGGVVKSSRDGTALYLLVRASRPPYDWVLPKGHIEPGETPEDTARREVREEAGVEADIVAPVGELSFEYRDREIRVRYFLMQASGTTTPLESREITWQRAGDALEMLNFESARAILRRAVALEALEKSKKAKGKRQK